jgi:plastocyanin
MTNLEGGLMSRVVRRAIPLAMLLVLVSSTQAGAAVFEVAVEDFRYEPRILRIRPGDTVNWTNNGVQPHTATSNAPLTLWDTGTLDMGQSASYVFTSAGNYLYHCTIHFDMTALVSVVPTASPRQGPVGTVFTIRVSSEDSPRAYVFDVQRKDPGQEFQDWVTGTTSATVTFDSTGSLPGTYQFRARIRRVMDNVTSLWSNPTSIRVTELG